MYSYLFVFYVHIYNKLRQAGQFPVINGLRMQPVIFGNLAAIVVFFYSIFFLKNEIYE